MRSARLPSTIRFACVATLCTYLAACSGDDSSERYDPLDAAAPSIDSSFDNDANGSDPTDARVVAPMDGGDADGGAVAANTCRVLADSDMVVAQRFFDPRSALSVAVHGQGALLSWSQYAGGKSHAYSRWFRVDKDPVDAPSVENGANQTEVHSSAIQEGFLTTWSEDTGGLLGRRSDLAGAPLDQTPFAIEAAFGATQAVSAQGADGKILLAYVGPAKGSTLLLGADLSPAGTPRDIPSFGAIVGRPALAAFGSGYLLAWADASTRRVHLQTLDAVGAPTSARLLDSDGDAQGNLDLATAETFGALVWDVRIAGSRAEVRFRAFGLDGNPTGVEQSLTPFPDSGLRPAVVAARGGFLVAYRSQQGTTLALRTLLLDGRGKPVTTASRSLTVTSLLQQDLPLAMRMTSDGLQFFLGWLDLTPNTSDYQLQRTWIGCD